jgi:uncharacterized protein (TIGR04255 family)
LEHLAKAPIVEAVIEFGVVPKAGTGVASLEAMRQEVEAQFGKMAEVYTMAGQITFDAKTGSSTSEIEEHAHIGYRTEPPAEGRLVTLTVSSVAFHELAPYSSWDDVLPQAWDQWLVYRRHLEPESVRRIGARYINRLDLPAPRRLREYLPRLPEVDEGHKVRGYLKQLMIRDEKSDLLANMLEALEIRRGDEVRVGITIDNDVYWEGHLLPNDSERIQAILEQIHTLKNTLFREALTDVALAPYKE